LSPLSFAFLTPSLCDTPLHAVANEGSLRREGTDTPDARVLRLPSPHRWQGLPRETIYAVNTSELELREDTLLFCLLGKGGQRKQAVINIVQQRLEPYHTLLYNFDRSFLIMTQTQQLQQLDPETLQDFKDLHDAREEALRQSGLEKGREIGLEEGREIGLEEGRREIAKNLLAQGIPHDVIVKATGLSYEQIASLLHQQHPTTTNKTS